VLVPLFLASAALARAAPRERCFSATGYCISGEIVAFWEQNGGLAVFGYPITPLQREQIEGELIDVQWFERHRLELHPSLPPAYRVQLGRLGVERLAQQGRAPSQGGPPPAEGCRLFPETGHSVCGELLRAWMSVGVEIDGRPGTSDSERMALFGLPLTDEQPETLSDGRTYTVQWFERARMEIHPELPTRSRVLFGLLGSELGPRSAGASMLSLVQPVQIVISAIGLDGVIVPAGLDATGAPAVPKHDVGWYILSAAPGEGENVVLWGHVLRFIDEPQIPAPFARVKNLRPGDTITISNRGGDPHTYVVTQQIWARPDEVQYIQPQGHEQLTLVSCIGDQVIVEGEVIDISHRLITIALPQG
jgi:hypothetical protein